MRVNYNAKRPKQRIRPRLPLFAMAEPGSKKTPVKDAFLDEGLYRDLREKYAWLVPTFAAGFKFSGGSTAKAMDMLEKNHGYLAVVADEARNFFPASMSATGQCNESQHLKPEALLPFRTGGGVERQLLKSQKDIEKTQVGMAFMSQFPAARAFLVQVIKNLSIGWAQGFVFLYAEDRLDRDDLDNGWIVLQTGFSESSSCSFVLVEHVGISLVFTASLPLSHPAL